MIQTCIVLFVYHYLYRDLYSDVYCTFCLSLSLSRYFIAFLNSLWSARSLSERLVSLVIFAEPFLASLFARDLKGVFLSVSFRLLSSRILSEKSLWYALSLSERLVLLAIFAESLCASRFTRDKPCCSCCIFV